MGKIKFEERKDPQIAVNPLGEYMVASPIRQNAIVQEAKYRPIMKVISYSEARLSIAQYISGGKGNIGLLKDKADSIEARLANDAKDAQIFKINAGMIRRFIAISNHIAIPPGHFMLGNAAQSPKMDLGGMPISVAPDLVVSVEGKGGARQCGAIKIRYSKGKQLKKDEGEHVSTLLEEYAWRYLQDLGTPDKSLCFCLDVQSGALIASPKATARKLANMEASCVAIVERWPSVKPPDDAE